MENILSQSLLSQTLKKKTCLTNKNRKNKNGNIKHFFSERSYNIREKKNSTNVTDEFLNGSDRSQNSQNSSTLNQDRSYNFEDVDENDSFDLFVPFKVTKLSSAKSAHVPSEESDTANCKNKDNALSSYFKEVTSYTSKIENLKQCPICLSHFSNIQLHLNSCMKKYCLSPEEVSITRSLRNKFDTERSKLGLPLLSSTKLKLKETDCDDAFFRGGTNIKSLRESLDNGNLKTAELKWSGKRKTISGNSLLLRRTNEEREKIITEKVAIVLMGSDSKDVFSETSITLESEHLMKQRNEDLVLWNKASRSCNSLEISDFYIPKFSSYIGPIIKVKFEPYQMQGGNQDERKLGNMNDSSTTPIFFQCSEKESEIDSKIKEVTQNIYSSFMEIKGDVEEKTEKHCMFCSGTVSTEVVEKENKEFNEASAIYNQLCSDEQLIHSDKSKEVLREINKSKLSFTGVNKEFTTEDNYLETLCKNWDRFVGRVEFSDITVLLSEGSTMCVHSLVLSVRCKNILSDLVNETGSKTTQKFLKWPDISFNACFAFFKYIYSGNIYHLEKLSLDDIACVRKLCTLYCISDLNKVLNRVCVLNYSLSGYSSDVVSNSGSEKCVTEELSSRNDQLNDSASSSQYKFENVYKKQIINKLNANPSPDISFPEHLESCKNVCNKLNESLSSVKSCDIKRKHSDSLFSVEDLGDSKKKRLKLFNSTEGDIMEEFDDSTSRIRRNSEKDMFDLDDIGSDKDDEIKAMERGSVVQDKLLFDSVVKDAFDESFNNPKGINDVNISDNSVKQGIKIPGEDCDTDSLNENAVDTLKNERDHTENDLPTGFGMMKNYSTFSFPDGVTSSPNIDLESHVPHSISSLTECPKNIKLKEKCSTQKPEESSLDKYFVNDSFPAAHNILDEIELCSSQTLVVNSNDNGSSQRQIISNERTYPVCLTPSPQVIISDKVTPMPNYSTMISPELKNELRKYGLKPGLDRRKAKMLLRYIYDQIHPVLTETNGYSPKICDTNGSSPCVKFSAVPRRKFYLSEDNSDTESCKSFTGTSPSIETDDPN